MVNDSDILLAHPLADGAAVSRSQSVAGTALQFCLPALLFGALLWPTQPALADFIQSGPKLVGTGAVGPATQGYSVALSAADRVRITGQLIDATTGTHVWAERYDRRLEDLFALQDEITLSVVGAIEPSLRDAEIERVRRTRPDSLDAYDLVLRATPHALRCPMRWGKLYRCLKEHWRSSPTTHLRRD